MKRLDLRLAAAQLPAIPVGCRFLDLFAGTGEVTLMALRSTPSVFSANAAPGAPVRWRLGNDTETILRQTAYDIVFIAHQRPAKWLPFCRHTVLLYSPECPPGFRTIAPLMHFGSA